MILRGKANSKPLVMYDFTIRLKKYISTCKKYKHADISKEKSRKWLSATARAERGEGWKARARRQRGSVRPKRVSGQADELAFRLRTRHHKGKRPALTIGPENPRHEVVVGFVLDHGGDVVRSALEREHVALHGAVRQAFHEVQHEHGGQPAGTGGRGRRVRPLGRGLRRAGARCPSTRAPVRNGGRRCAHAEPVRDAAALTGGSRHTRLQRRPRKVAAGRPRLKAGLLTTF